MRLGGFGKIADYSSIWRAGFDYAELDVPEIESMPEREFCIFNDKVHKSGFPVLIGARALPAAEPLFFTDYFRAADFRDYLENACRRANLLGMDKIILGNGKARQLPDDTSISKEHQFIEFMRMFAEIAGNSNLEVILEPLGPEYSNYINTLPEAVRMIHEVNMPNLFTMADLRHLHWSKEPLANIEQYADYVHHIHIDYPVSYPARPFPRAEDDFDYSEFLAVIKNSGYQDTLTVEADTPKDWNRAYTAAAGVLKDVL